MPYVHRTALGDIDSLYREAMPGASEFLESDHPDVRRFVGGDLPAGFALLDAQFVRVLEDLIDTLVARNLISTGDLPEPSQGKLAERKTVRDQLSGKSLRLFSNSGMAELIDDTGFGSL